MAFICTSQDATDIPSPSHVLCIQLRRRSRAEHPWTLKVCWAEADVSKHITPVSVLHNKSWAKGAVNHQPPA